MKLANDIAATLFKLMAPEPETTTASIDRIPCMAVHEGSMAAVIELKLKPVKDALESIRLLDGTVRYDYGEPRKSDGKIAEEGRWLTPREKAESLLSMFAEDPS